MGTFVCFEVGINNEIVDCLTYNTKNEWRCYELKVSVSDFHSKQAKTFVGNYNYYVIPSTLFDKVKDEIPENVGVIVNGNSVIKKPKKQGLSVNESVMYYSMIKSLYRNAEKYLNMKQNDDIDDMQRLRQQKNSEIKELKEQCERYKKNIQWLRKNDCETIQKLSFLEHRAKPEDIQEMKNTDF